MQRPINQVLAEHTARWLSLPGVVGTGQGICRGRPCIKILVVSNARRVRRRVPTVIDGYSVFVENAGEPTAYPEDAD